MNNDHLFLMVLEPGKFTIKPQAASVSSWFIRHLLAVTVHSGKRESSCTLALFFFLVSFFIKAWMPFMMLYLHDLITSQRPHLLIPSLWGLGFNLWMLGRHKHSVYIALWSFVIPSFENTFSSSWNVPSFFTEYSAYSYLTLLQLGFWMRVSHPASRPQHWMYSWEIWKVAVSQGYCCFGCLNDKQVHGDVTISISAFLTLGMIQQRTEGVEDLGKSFIFSVSLLKWQSIQKSSTIFTKLL